jgi:hypothetical protein
LSNSFFECVKTVFDENSFVTVSHPQYNPDLRPSDFWLFGHLQTSLTVRVFNDVDEPPEAIIEFLNEIQASELQRAFHHWTEQ